MGASIFMKSTDVAKELREFNKVFNMVAGYKWDDYTVFSDFLQYTIYALNTGRTEDDVRWYERMKVQYAEDYKYFPLMFRELVLTYHAQITANEGAGAWYDPLGDYYMELAGRSKQSAFGQFFTPREICDFMTALNAPENAYGKGLKVNDCACGSARMLLAFHAHASGNFMYGEDIDPMCVNMAAINMAFHGCVGQVRRMDSLSMRFYHGYAVNPQLTRYGLVSLHPLRHANDEFWLCMQPNYQRPEPEPKTQKPENETKIVIAGTQLKIF